MATVYTIHHIRLGASLAVVTIVNARRLRMHDLIPLIGKRFLSVLESFQIGCESQCLLGAHFPGVRRPGRGIDHLSPSAAQLRMCGAIPLPAWHAR